jgi:hypothetical protein
MKIFRLIFTQKYSQKGNEKEVQLLWKNYGGLPQNEKRVIGGKYDQSTLSTCIKMS